MQSEIGFDSIPDITWKTISQLMDKNGDGKVSLAEYKDAQQQWQAQGDKIAQMELAIQAMDVNSDGYLDRVLTTRLTAINIATAINNFFKYSSCYKYSNCYIMNGAV